MFPMDSSAVDRVPGLVYVADFASAAEEANILDALDAGSWTRPWFRGVQMKRATQNFGWDYPYVGSIEPHHHVGPLPAWAADLAARVRERLDIDDEFDQMIATSYDGDAGIGAHTDHPDFGSVIVGISLLHPVTMVFVGPDGESVDVWLEPGSLFAMTGDARYRWTHEIRTRRTETSPLTGRRERRGRRISLTFRWVISADPPM